MLKQNADVIAYFKVIARTEVLAGFPLTSQILVYPDNTYLDSRLFHSGPNVTGATVEFETALYGLVRAAMAASKNASASMAVLGTMVLIAGSSPTDAERADYQVYLDLGMREIGSYDDGSGFGFSMVLGFPAPTASK